MLMVRYGEQQNGRFETLFPIQIELFITFLNQLVSNRHKFGMEPKMVPC